MKALHAGGLVHPLENRFTGAFSDIVVLFCDVFSPPKASTPVLVANTSPFEGAITVTLLFEDGTAPMAETFPIAATSRFNIVPPFQFPAACPAGGSRRFGMLVESEATGGHDPAQIVVERAMYSDANGVFWAAGTNAVATKLK